VEGDGRLSRPDDGVVRLLSGKVVLPTAVGVAMPGWRKGRGGRGVVADLAAGIGLAGENGGCFSLEDDVAIQWCDENWRVDGMADMGTGDLAWPTYSGRIGDDMEDIFLFASCCLYGRQRKNV